jgi:HPt (histidine-containing phosphotransfer) domain-containing protein
MKSSDQPEPRENAGHTALPDLASAIDKLWARFQPEIRKRVEVLEAAASACSAGQLSNEQREATHAAAHKLAGTLGIFNLSQGTDLAREFELIFFSENASEPAQSNRLNAIAAELRTIVDNRK